MPRVAAIVLILGSLVILWNHSHFRHTSWAINILQKAHLQGTLARGSVKLEFSTGAMATLSRSSPLQSKPLPTDSRPTIDQTLLGTTPSVRRSVGVTGTLWTLETAIWPFFVGTLGVITYAVIKPRIRTEPEEAAPCATSAGPEEG